MGNDADTNESNENDIVWQGAPDKEIKNQLRHTNKYNHWQSLAVNTFTHSLADARAHAHAPNFSIVMIDSGKMNSFCDFRTWRWAIEKKRNPFSY